MLGKRVVQDVDFGVVFDVELKADVGVVEGCQVAGRSQGLHQVQIDVGRDLLGVEARAIRLLSPCHNDAQFLQSDQSQLYTMIKSPNAKVTPEDMFIELASALIHTQLHSFAGEAKVNAVNPEDKSPPIALSAQIVATELLVDLLRYLPDVC